MRDLRSQSQLSAKNCRISQIKTNQFKNISNLCIRCCRANKASSSASGPLTSLCSISVQWDWKTSSFNLISLIGPPRPSREDSTTTVNSVRINMGSVCSSWLTRAFIYSTTPLRFSPDPSFSERPVLKDSELNPFLAPDPEPAVTVNPTPLALKQQTEIKKLTLVFIYFLL